jgi:hypothetical protein
MQKAFRGRYYERKQTCGIIHALLCPNHQPCQRPESKNGFEPFTRIFTIKSTPLGASLSPVTFFARVAVEHKAAVAEFKPAPFFGSSG